MNTVVFEKKKTKESSLIPNSLIEEMFLSIADDEQMQYYIKAAQSENPAVRAGASAYASQKVRRTFMYFRDNFIKNGGDLEFLQFILWKRTRMG